MLVGLNPLKKNLNLLLNFKRRKLYPVNIITFMFCFVLFFSDFSINSVRNVPISDALILNKMRTIPRSVTH